MAVFVQTNPKKTVIHKTIYEYCNSDANLEEEAVDIARRLGGEFTSDDLHVLDVSVEKMGKSTNIYGALINSLLGQKRIALIDFVPSRRRESHHRRIGRYRLVR